MSLFRSLPLDFSLPAGRIEYDEYVKWKTEDAGKYGEKESAFTAAHAEMWTQIRFAPLPLLERVAVAIPKLRCAQGSSRTEPSQRSTTSEYNGLMMHDERSNFWGYINIAESDLVASSDRCRHRSTLRRLRSTLTSLRVPKLG